MLKNYSVEEIKSLLEKTHEQIFESLLGYTTQNNLYYEQFTVISLKTLKYMNQYINKINHNQDLGDLIDKIISDFTRSLNEYKSKNIYVDSCITSPINHSDQQKEEDQIYHFLNTRNSTIPMQILGNPELDRQRLQLAEFVQKMETKKKGVLKQSKRSLQLPKQAVNNFKVFRKATYDPSLIHRQQSSRFKKTDSNLENQQFQNIRNSEEAQTQTDLLGPDFERQFEKEEQLKSQVDNLVIQQGTYAVQIKQQVIEQPKTSQKVMAIKKKKSNKTLDGKNSKPKKKAQIITSIKEHKTPQIASKKTINISNFGDDRQIETPGKWQRENSIKSFKKETKYLELSSKEVNLFINCQPDFHISVSYLQRRNTTVEESELLKSIETELQIRKPNKKEEMKLPNEKIANLTSLNAMDVINQTWQQHNHSLKSQTDFCKLHSYKKSSSNSSDKVLQSKNQIFLNTEESKQKDSNNLVIRNAQHKLTIASVQCQSNIQAIPIDSRDKILQSLVGQIHLSRNKSKQGSKRLTIANMRQGTDTRDSCKEDQPENRQLKSIIRNSKCSLDAKTIIPKLPSPKAQSTFKKAKDNISQSKESFKCNESRDQRGSHNSNLNESKIQKQANALTFLLQSAQKMQCGQNKYEQDNQFASNWCKVKKKELFSHKYTSLLETSGFNKTTNKFEVSNDYHNRNINSSMNNKQLIKKKIKNRNSMIVMIKNNKKSNQRQSFTANTQTVKDNAFHNIRSDSKQQQNIKNQLKNILPDNTLSKQSDQTKIGLEKIQSKLQRISRDHSTKNVLKKKNQGMYHSLHSSKQNLETLANLRGETSKMNPKNKHNKSTLSSLQQSETRMIACSLRQKGKRQVLRQYLDLMEVAHKKFCGQKCSHIENLYKKFQFDGKLVDENVLDQLARILKTSQY